MSISAGVKDISYINSVLFEIFKPLIVANISSTFFSSSESKIVKDKLSSLKLKSSIIISSSSVKYFTELAIVLILDTTASCVLTPSSICNPPCRSNPRLIFLPESVCINEGIANTTPKIILNINITSL